MCEFGAAKLQSSLIGKVEKAKVYAQERHRMQVEQLTVRFTGANADHIVSLVEGAWHCSCDFFEGWKVCSHTMALERVMDGMVPQQSIAPSGDN